MFTARTVTTICAALAAVLLIPPGEAEARRGRGATRTHVNPNVSRARTPDVSRANRDVSRNVNRGANRDVNRSVNRDVNRDIDRSFHGDIDLDVDRDYYGRYGWGYPAARAVGVAAATTATAIAVGTVVATLPSSCASVVVGGVAYQQCGSTWYQPRYAGSQVTYVVVDQP